MSQYIKTVANFYGSIPSKIVSKFTGRENFGDGSMGVISWAYMIFTMVYSGYASWMANSGINPFLHVIYALFAFLAGPAYIWYYLYSKSMYEVAYPAPIGGFDPLTIFRAPWNRPFGEVHRELVEKYK